MIAYRLLWPVLARWVRDPRTPAWFDRRVCRQLCAQGLRHPGAPARYALSSVPVPVIGVIREIPIYQIPFYHAILVVVVGLWTVA